MRLSSLLDSHLEDDAEFAKFCPMSEGQLGQELIPELQELISDQAAGLVYFVEKNRYSFLIRQA